MGNVEWIQYLKEFKDLSLIYIDIYYYFSNKDLNLDDRFKKVELILIRCFFFCYN